jgi:hypothetical protein
MNNELPQYENARQHDTITSMCCAANASRNPEHDATGVPVGLVSYMIDNRERHTPQIRERMGTIKGIVLFIYHWANNVRSIVVDETTLAEI